MAERAAVTGAFSYSGGEIARQLLERGVEVVSLSRRTPPATHPLAGRVGYRPLQFDRPAELAAAMAGAEVLFNTYWIRFERPPATFDQAVSNSRVLFQAAGQVGVRRIVHLSVTNPSLDSPFAYFRGKAQVERALAETTGEHAVIRPTLVFGGREEILINNMAWFLRRLPVFAVPGDGRYRVQPVHVRDVARLAVAAAGGSGASTQDAAGPEIYTYDELLGLLAASLRFRRQLVHVPLPVVEMLGRASGLLLRDRVITREELGALMDELLISSSAPTGQISFAEWLASADTWLGRRYANELQRNWRRSG